MTACRVIPSYVFCGAENVTRSIAEKEQIGNFIHRRAFYMSTRLRHVTCNDILLHVLRINFIQPKFLRRASRKEKKKVAVQPIIFALMSDIWVYFIFCLFLGK